MAEGIKLSKRFGRFRLVNNTCPDEALVFEDQEKKVVLEGEEVTNYERFLRVGGCPARDDVFHIRKFFGFDQKFLETVNP